jgi:hypothetical protein
MIEKPFFTKIILEIIRADDRESDVVENIQNYTTIIKPWSEDIQVSGPGFTSAERPAPVRL